MYLAPKIDELRCFVNDTKPDLISLTETWLNDSVSEHHINIPGFNPRANGAERRSGH